ncbi:MAG TPA: flavin reductase family protein [Acidimicrobiales bacterium]|jgi:flavin reductase (DIM6/NTAB) family NADH-FMN oxidoreductase RutF|nr:flavin reductase family protein [Acidimicrobiales bacterium]
MPARAPVVGPVPAGADPEAYDRLRRRVLWLMPAGIYLLGSRDGERRNLMTLTWAMQVATEPKLVALAVESGAVTLELVRASKAMALSLLPPEARPLVRRFAKPAVHDASARTLSGLPYEDAAVSGAPVLVGALAHLDLALRHELPLGSHSLLVAEVLDAQASEAAGPGARALRLDDTRMNYGG